MRCWRLLLVASLLEAATTATVAVTAEMMPHHGHHHHHGHHKHHHHRHHHGHRGRHAEAVNRSAVDAAADAAVANRTAANVVAPVKPATANRTAAKAFAVAVAVTAPEARAPSAAAAGVAAPVAAAAEPSSASAAPALAAELPAALAAGAMGRAAGQGETSKATRTQERILGKMKALERELSTKEAAFPPRLVVLAERHLKVNGPLPHSFSKEFARAVAEATDSDAARVKVVKSVNLQDGIIEVTFQAPIAVAEAVQEQAADPDSRLANGPLHNFLVAKDVPAHFISEVPDSEDSARNSGSHGERKGHAKAADGGGKGAGGEGADGKDAGGGREDEPEPEPEEEPKGPGEEDADGEGAPPHSNAEIPMQRGIDVDVEMPYGQLEPFGREDTAQELTEAAISESNMMVDQLERAEVAEEKRAVFRALTRLRGAAITAFDGIARVQTGTIDEYNKLHRWREAHPLRHLADDESDVSKWAFPDF
uniref:Uncharacterized protein n=1 Tax=Pyrodinium bahamense TaxID=73915 RepID=A0A7R9ZZN4_9DINO|mmetsp:Transcript_16365/g.45082  ORF Transcript_16365/g.45082 Transcript_16365/m.45082 type:complete len:481 (+) Transcript_16365:80-1522(+)